MEFADRYLLFDGFSFTTIRDKDTISTDFYEEIEHGILGRELRIVKAFVKETCWCYVTFDNGAVFHVYPKFADLNWWQQSELIKKGNTAGYHAFLKNITDDDVAEIDLMNLKN